MKSSIVSLRYQHADGSRYEGQWKEDKQFGALVALVVEHNPDSFRCG